MIKIRNLFEKLKFWGPSISGKNESKLAYVPEVSAPRGVPIPKTSDVFLDQLSKQTNLPKRKLRSLIRKGMTVDELKKLLDRERGE